MIRNKQQKATLLLFLLIFYISIFNVYASTQATAKLNFINNLHESLIASCTGETDIIIPKIPKIGKPLDKDVFSVQTSHAGILTRYMHKTRKFTLKNN